MSVPPGQAIYTSNTLANVTVTEAAVPIPPANPRANSSVGAPSLYAGSTNQSALSPYASQLGGATNITTYLSGNTALSGLLYAPGGNVSSSTAVFQFLVNSTTYGGPLGQNGFPINQLTQTVVLILDLCNSTWDTSLTLVDPFSKARLAW